MVRNKDYDLEIKVIDKEEDTRPATAMVTGVTKQLHTRNREAVYQHSPTVKSTY